MKLKYLFFFVFLLFLFTCKKEKKKEFTTPPEIDIKTIVTGYEIIWGMDFLPNGDLLFGEKRGKLYKKSGDNITEISGLPQVQALGQGGLLDIKVHPNYSTNGWVYASYSSASSEGGGGQLNLIRFKIISNQVQNIQNLFSTTGANKWNGHYGSRIVFDSKNYLHLSVGEGGTGSYGGPNATNKNAQDLKSSWGKIHRFADDGSVPADNPVFQGNNAPTSIYSYGHRNPQGLTLNPQTNELWETEHGPSGGDEVNIIVKAGNYGWPTYSIGKNYDGTNISSGQHTATGITTPLYTWTPSIATCGITFIKSDKFKLWKGNLLVSGLASNKLVRCVIQDNKIVEESILLGNSGRVRNVIQAPNGSIYVSVEGPGRIIEIIPK
jgi:aldose sugar dehydrogenase